MSQRFIRCPHCGLPHSVEEPSCPITGRPIDLRRGPRSAEPSFSQEDSMQRQPSAGPAIQPFEIKASQHPSQRGPTVAPPPASSTSLRNAQPAPFDSSEPGAPTLIGQTLGGKYRAMRVLGEGGMGTVYECLHIALNRRVAVKVLHPSQARKRASVQRFHHEAQVASAIGHANICEIYDMGESEDGSPFLVMELLQGETLADRIASEGALPFDDVVEIITQVLSGLIAAHEKTIIHRDIKPENIFLQSRPGSTPLAKILDFGISKVAGGEELNLTRTGMVMGTPFYMSPEQARGDRALDHRVDIYATGVMMYECLTGRRPFTAANYNALLVQILTTLPRPPHDIRPAVPEGFEAVVMKAMHRERDKRFRTAIEMQKTLVTLRDPVAAGVRRIASIPPEPVPLVTPRRDRSPESARQAKPVREHELPAISVDLEGRDLLDSGLQEPAGDSGSIEIPIVHEELSSASPPSGLRRQEPSAAIRPAYRPEPQPTARPSSAGVPRPIMARPVAQKPSKANKPSMPPPLPSQRKARMITPTPTPVDPRLLNQLKGTPWAFERNERFTSQPPDPDPTEIGSIPMHQPTEASARPPARRIDADATERIDPPKVVGRVGKRPRSVREVNAPLLPDPRREVEAPRAAPRPSNAPSIPRPSRQPPPTERVPEDEQPTTLFDRSALQSFAHPDPTSASTPSSAPVRGATTERAPAPSTLGRPPLPSSDEPPRPVSPRVPRRGP